MPSIGNVRLAVLITILVTGSASASHAGNFYEGSHREWVDRLLSVAGAWDCDSYQKPPAIKADGCERDKQVSAAVTAAWRAECLARDGENDKAGAAAEEMFNHLKTAAGMCLASSLPQMDGSQKSCETGTVFDCEAFRP